MTPVDLTPYSEGQDEAGSTVYPTRRVQALQAAPHVLWVWRLARIEWFDLDSFGTSWDSIDRALFVRGVAA